MKWLATSIATYIFYAAYCITYQYKNLVNVAGLTRRVGELNASDTANTPD